MPVAKPRLERIGRGQHPLVIIDDFLGRTADLVAIAKSIGPYPRANKTFYPGVRRMISEGDGAAARYVEWAMQTAAPYIWGAFDVRNFSLTAASFSIVSTQPSDLLPVQRGAHFDSPDPDNIALLHYLSVPPGTGTGFFRHRATGIERVDEQNLARYVAHAQAETMRLAPDSGYIQGSDERFEMYHSVEAVPDRIIFYQGSLLHSGLIPPGMPLDSDPSAGRLTANFFVHLDR